MTHGEILKRNLGLETFKYVKINRAVISSYKILFVWFDSYRKTMPVTNYRIKSFPWVAHIFHGTELFHGTDRQTTFTPPIDIEDYNGQIRGSLVVPVNLAGDRFISKGDFSKVFESIEKETEEIKPLLQFNQTLLEFVTLYDLADKGNISDFTMTWRKDRNRVMGQENTTAKLIDCFIDEADKSVTFAFLTEATELGGKDPNDNIDSDYRFYSSPKGEIDPETLELKRNRSRTYEIQIKILDFFDWLDVFEGEKVTQKEMKEILEVSNVQIFNTSPSFQLQGINYWISQIDGSIYPEGRKPQRWNAPNLHGDSGAFLDKHTYGLLRQIKFWINPMASMLNKKLNDRNLI
jgi:hypothetical protein